MGINTCNWDDLDTGWELSASSSEFGIELPCSISHGVRHINKKIIKSTWYPHNTYHVPIKVRQQTHGRPWNSTYFTSTLQQTGRTRDCRK